MGPGAVGLETLLGIGTPALAGAVDGGGVAGDTAAGAEVVGTGKLGGGGAVVGAGPIKLGAAMAPLEEGATDGATVEGTLRTHDGQLGADADAGALAYPTEGTTPPAEGPTE